MLRMLTQKGTRRRIFHQSCCLGLTSLLLIAGSPGSAQTSDEPTVTATHIVTPHDTIPRFCGNPTIVAQSSGSWSNPNTWSTNQVPGSGARVSISQNLQVTYNVHSDAEIDCIEIADQAEMRWATNQDTRLRATHIQVLPHGILTIGSAGSPISASHVAEIIIRDVALDVNGSDPSQYGNGLNVFGTMKVHGTSMDRSYLRFANDAHLGQTTLQLEQSPVGWKIGDRLIIPDTRQIPFRKKYKYFSQAEESTVLSISGATVTLSAPLRFDHWGPRDADGDVGVIEQGMLPHVGNLTRNVIIRSTRLAETSKAAYCMGEDNINNPSNCVTRGHALFLHRATVDIRYASFENLGRTTNDSLDNTVVDGSGNATSIGLNQIGRYSLHMHRVMGPVNPSNTGYQYHLIGNVIEGMLKWGLAIHDTHYGLIKDNIAYDGQGAAITTEDGNESFNVLERNFVVHTKAGDEEQVLESPKRGGVFSSRQLFGTTRDGFWFSGMNNYIRDNVVANSPDFAYNYNGYYLTPNQPVPNFRGANMATDSTIHVALPVLESARNEAYGATGQGLWATWSRGCCSVGRYTDVSLFKDYRIWHVNHSAAEFYHESRNTLDGFIVRNDPAISAQSQGGSLRFNRGFHFSNGSYENGQTIFRNIDMQGFNVGIRLPLKPEDGTEEPNVTILEDSFLKNYVNIQEGLPNINEKETVIRNVRTETLNILAISGQPAQPTSIHMRYSLSRHTNLVGRTAHTFVYDFNGVTGNNFEVYFEEQAPNYQIPPDPDFNGRLVGCPDRNTTNQECMDRHGIAIAGVVAPCVAIDGEATCASARARAAALGIQGLVFPIGGTVNQPPNAQISPNNVSGEAPFTLALSGSTSTDSDGSIVSYSWNFGDGNTDSGAEVTHTFQDEGAYVVELRVTDNQGETDLATTTVTVTGSAPNMLPVVGDDTANTQGGNSVVIDVIANDQDDDDGLDLSTVTILNGPTQGSVTVHPDGKITYSHDGVDTFTYTIRDASGAVSNVGTVTIQIE